MWYIGIDLHRATVVIAGVDDSGRAIEPARIACLDTDAILDGIRGIGFGGWLVVEQDIFPRTAERFARAARDQRDNRAFLAARDL